MGHSNPQTFLVLCYCSLVYCYDFQPKFLPGIFLFLIKSIRVMGRLLILPFWMHSCCVYIMGTFGFISLLNTSVHGVLYISCLFFFYCYVIFRCMNRSQFVYPFSCRMHCSSFWLLQIRLLWTFYTCRLVDMSCYLF